MTWVVVVKFWAYQAYQLRIIVYTKTIRTIHGLELFSSANRQWGKVQNATAPSDITLPLSANPFVVVANDMNMNQDPLILATDGYGLGKFKIDGRRVNRTDTLWGRWIAICI